MLLFIKKIITAAAVFAAATGILLLLSSLSGFNHIIGTVTNSISYTKGNTGPEEIIPFLEKVQTDDGTGILFVGDSLCRQMFNGLQEYNPDISLCGTNAAISLCGQYVFIYEYLRTHTDVSDVYLIVTPGTLQADLSAEWGYLYAVMPFAETDTLHLMDRHTIGQMKRHYGTLFLMKQIVRIIDRSGLNRKIYLNLQKQFDSSPFEDSFVMADLYIPKINDLCAVHGVKFHLLPCPLADTEGKREEMNRQAALYSQKAASSLFPDFYDQLLYYDESMFSDGFHFGGVYAEQSELNKVIEEMYLNTGLICDLSLSERIPAAQD